MVVLCVTDGVTLCAGDVCDEWCRWWFHVLQVVLPFVLVTCVLRVVVRWWFHVLQVVLPFVLVTCVLRAVQVVVSCVTGGVTFCAGDLCAESSTGGDQSPSPCSHAACAPHDRLHGAGQYQFTIQAKNPFWYVWHLTCPLTPPCLCRTGTSMRLSLSTNDHAKHFLNLCRIKLAEVIHRNQSNNHCNWSDTWPSVLLMRALQANTQLPSLSRTCTNTHPLILLPLIHISEPTRLA